MIEHVRMATAARGLWTLAVIASLASALTVAIPAQPADAASPAQNASAATVLLDDIIADIPAPTRLALSLEAANSYAAGRGSVGVAVIDRQTGAYADNGPLANSAMGSASVIKVVLAEELLHRAAIGAVALGPSELARMETMLIDSNDAAASSLYGQFGGTALITAAFARHGMTQSAPPLDPQYWGNTQVTAHDIALFYADLLDGSLPAQSRDYLIALLQRIAPTASDGFGQFYGLAGLAPPPASADPVAVGAPPAAPVPAVKQGWMCCLDGVRNVHSTAVVGLDNRYVVVILTEYPPSLPWEYGQSTTTEVARLVLTELPL